MASELERQHASTSAAMHYREDELPRELILSIERVLDIRSGTESDPLDVLTNDFNAVNMLNKYFPNGVLCSSERRACIRFR